MDFDDILPEIGEYGTYQKLVVWLLLIPAIFPCAFHGYNQVFMATVPDHWCLVPGLKEQHPNASEDIIRKISIPFDNATNSFSRCQRYDLNFEELFSEFLSENFVENKEKTKYLASVHASAKVIPCDRSWHYELEEYTTSIVSDWDLVCGDEFLPVLALVLLSSSGLVGSYVFGIIQDGMGRRPAFFIYLIIICFFGLATAFAPSFNWWLGCRIGIGFAIPAIIVTPMVLAVELVGPTQRTYATILMNVSYSFALILLAVIVYFVRIWSQLALATTIPFLAFFGFWWVLPESPRWLLAKGREEEALKIITKMAKINKKPLRKDLLSCLKRPETKQEKKSKSSNGILDLFRTRNLRKKTIVITFIWFINTAVYVGLCYYAPSIGGDAYWNFFLAGVAELPTYLFIWPAMEYWGRRWTLCASMVIGGISCVATVLAQNDHMTTLILFCLGKGGISTSFVALPLTAAELYPTVVRGIGLGFSSTIAMIGPIVIPLINYLGTTMMVLPLMIMGVLLMLGGLSSLLLPETLHQNLPQTVEEAENFGKFMSLKEYCDCCPRRRVIATGKEELTEEEQETKAEKENKLIHELDTFEPLPSDDFFDFTSSYSSLRRYSFKKAQSEAIPLDEHVTSPLMKNNTSQNGNHGGAQNDKIAPKKITKKERKNIFKNSNDSLITTPSKITII